MRDSSQISPFKTETRPYEGSCIPLWLVFAASLGVASWAFVVGGTHAEIISFVALIVLSISGSILFVAIINYFNHTPIKVTVTSHAIRIDDGDEQTIIRLVDLVEIQRSHSFFQDEVVLKAIGDREFSLENLRDPDEFLNSIVANASTMASSRKVNGRAASFSLVTSRGPLKLQEMVGRKQCRPEASSLELTNNFSVFLSTFPLIAVLPSLGVAFLALVCVVSLDIAPMAFTTVTVSALIVPSLFMIICYVLFVEKQISIDGNQIVIETSNERIMLPKTAITNVTSTRSGLSRVIKIDTHNQGAIKLKGFSNSDSVEDVIRWVTASAATRDQTERASGESCSCTSAAAIFRVGTKSEQLAR